MRGVFAVWRTCMMGTLPGVGVWPADVYQSRPPRERCLSTLSYENTYLDMLHVT